MEGLGNVFNPVVRFLGYFLLVFAALFVLRELPILGGIFRIPLLGFFLAAIVVSWGVARVGAALSARAKFTGQLRELGTVDTPQMRGKLGRLLLQSGRAREALEPLAEAAAADPQNVDWQFRLGCAHLATGEARAALPFLERAIDLNARHAYGGALLKLAEAQHLAGEGQAALAALDHYERLQGPTAESAFRRGLALKGLGAREEARAAFDTVAEHVRSAPRYQKAEARSWAARAVWARWF